jgi:alpha-D-ribose 1-methylphosphonate 5-triphosphate synthase subunit PhnG
MASSAKPPLAFLPQTVSGDLDIQMTKDVDDLAADPASGLAIEQRKAWLAVLARAERQDLERAAADSGQAQSWETIRPAESGMVMLRGRVGGTGEAFNLGEATVTRCALRLASGSMGIGYTLGRDRRKAELVAFFDALLQDDAQHGKVAREVIEPLAFRQFAARQASSTAAAASRVEFFTMVRGET